ncbi:hypothetical protein D3C76_1262530 [compost metagenome]
MSSGDLSYHHDDSKQDYPQGALGIVVVSNTKKVMAVYVCGAHAFLTSNIGVLLQEALQDPVLVPGQSGRASLHVPEHGPQ